MTNLEVRRERYLKDSVSKRLGALAANLARLSSFSKGSPNLKIIESLLGETECFIEWTALDLPIAIQERLIQLQIQLAVYAYRLKQGKNEFQALSDEFQKRSDELLTASGLGN